MKTVVVIKFFVSFFDCEEAMTCIGAWWSLIAFSSGEKGGTQEVIPTTEKEDVPPPVVEEGWQQSSD